MILGNISYLDCLVFLVFLTPQLLLHVGLLKTTAWLVPALPFLCEYLRSLSDISKQPITTSYSNNSTTLKKILSRELFDSFFPCLNKIHSIQNTPPVPPRTLLDAPGPALSFRSTRHFLSRSRHPLRPLCFCEHACLYRPCVFQQRGVTAIHMVPYVEAWVLEVSDFMGGDQEGM